MANIATKAILGQSILEQGYKNGLAPTKSGVYVKVPVFSFAKLRRVDITLGPEMKSTGEVMGKDMTLEKALYKGLVASGMEIKEYGSVLITVSDKDKEEVIGIARRFTDTGYRILATEGTAAALKNAGIRVKIVGKIGSEGRTLLDVIQKGEAQFVINTLTKGKQPERDGFRIRRESVENGVPCFTSLDTAEAMLRVIETMTFQTEEMGKQEAIV